MNITLGCDPEFFVKNGNKHVCAWGLVDGTKDCPENVQAGAVQVDGYALEFNIEPVMNPQDFVKNIETVLAQFRDMVDPEYKFDIGRPVARFSKAYMEAQCEQANELGCDPDYNAWTLEKNIKPDNTMPMRTAAGHIHIGWEGEITQDDQIGIVKQMDLFLGLPSIIYDKDTLRRTMYGKASCFRYKPYGVEYRTLSNAWLKSKKRMANVARNAIMGAKRYFNGERFNIDVQDIINNSRVDDAKAIMKEFGILSI